MRFRRSFLLAALFSQGVWLPSIPAQGNPGAPPPVDQARIDQAIRWGAQFLKNEAPEFGARFNASELVTYTLLHAGVAINDPVLEEGLAWVKSLDVERLSFHDRTYRVALAAMTLEAVNAAVYRKQLAQLAQFLVCNQCENGQWSYGENIVLPKELQTPGEIHTGAGGGSAAPPGAGHKTAAAIPIRCPHPIGPPEGDFSNTQFALLGLRACALAGCDIPADTWARAEKILEQSQHNDGGWGYKAGGKGRMTVTGKGPGGPDAESSYGSMTCSGVCGLVIAKYYQREAWKGDRRIDKGLEWIAEHFTVEENPRTAKRARGGPGAMGQSWQYYYLYALERTGLLADTEQFGPHAWYPLGAEYLLGRQARDGGWQGEQNGGWIEDTCFAILFLRRATKPIVPVVGTK